MVCLSALLALSGRPAFAADPNFSGVWVLVEEQADHGRLPQSPWKQMSVDHKDTAIQCEPVEAKAEAKKPSRFGMNFATDGTETAHPVGEGSGKSIAKWEGSALLINTLVRTHQRSFTQMDRWKLSRDGSRLTIRRQIVNLHGDSESTLVYEKK